MPCFFNALAPVDATGVCRLNRIAQNALFRAFKVGLQTTIAPRSAVQCLQTNTAKPNQAGGRRQGYIKGPFADYGEKGKPFPCMLMVVAVAVAVKFARQA